MAGSRPWSSTEITKWPVVELFQIILEICKCLSIESLKNLRVFILINMGDFQLINTPTFLELLEKIRLPAI